MGKLKKVGIGIGGAFLALMVISVAIASMDNPHLEQAEIKLANVELNCINSEERRAGLATTFLVKNPSEKTFTIPLISYELFANGKSLGHDQYSVEDLEMLGRPFFYSGSEKPIYSLFQLDMSASNAKAYFPVLEGQPVDYSAEGVIIVESAWSIIEKEFKVSEEKTLGKKEAVVTHEKCLALISLPKIKSDIPSEPKTTLLTDRQVADLVKQYKGKDGKGDRLVDVLAAMINVAYPNENILDSPSTLVDWYAFPDLTKREGIYKVGFIFQTYKDDLEYIWYVDTNTNRISAGNSDAKAILDLLDIFD